MGKIQETVKIYQQTKVDPGLFYTMNGFETRRVSFIDHSFVPESNTKQH